MTAGVGQQIGHGALQGVGADRQDKFLFGRQAQVDGVAGARLGLDDFTGQGRQIGRAHRLAPLASGEREIALDHVLHIGDVALQLIQPIASAHHRQMQFHARQWRAQVVRDTGQHFSALG